MFQFRSVCDQFGALCHNLSCRHIDRKFILPPTDALNFEIGASRQPIVFWLKRKQLEAVDAGHALKRRPLSIAGILRWNRRLPDDIKGHEAIKQGRSRVLVEILEEANAGAR